jgi:DNA replication protein DnaC
MIREDWNRLAERHPGIGAIGTRVVGGVLDSVSVIGTEAWAGGLLFGLSGVGKSRRAFARACAVGAWYVKAYRYLDAARAVERDVAPPEVETEFGQMRTVAYLVLDDLGTRAPSEFVYEAVYRLLDERWESRRATLVTSNASLGRLAAVYDERVASRIASFGPVEEMKGGDWRVTERPVEEESPVPDLPFERR